MLLSQPCRSIANILTLKLLKFIFENLSFNFLEVSLNTKRKTVCIKEKEARALERSRQKVKQLQTFEQWWLRATVVSAVLSEVDNAPKLKEVHRRARLV